MKESLRSICLLCSAIFLIFAGDALPMSAGFQAKVVRVIDGDTVEVEYKNKIILVDLAWIDAPEKGQFYSLNARGLLSQWVMGKYVTVVEVGRHSVGITARLYVNGRDIAGSLVSMGAAWVSVSTARNVALIALQVEAKTNRRGLWQEEKPEPPWLWRSQQ